MKIENRRCRVVGTEVKRRRSPSHSVSYVVAEEDDVVWGSERKRDVRRLLLMDENKVSVGVCSLTCDDGGGLAPDLVLVHVLAVIQFPLHQNPGPGGEEESQDSSHCSLILAMRGLSDSLNRFR